MLQHITCRSNAAEQEHTSSQASSFIGGGGDGGSGIRSADGRTNSTLGLVGCCDAIVQQHATLDGRAITAILKPAGECIEQRGLAASCVAVPSVSHRRSEWSERESRATTNPTRP